MPLYSETSKRRLYECHVDLQKIFFEVIKYYDCMILVGERNEEEQRIAFENDYSKKKYPESKHNIKPSLATDAVPWFKDVPHIRWDDMKKFYEFGGFVQAIAKTLGIEIIWGGNWDRDQELDDQKFYDLAHFELA
ncbi:unnamed protein product [marine sediment metagenome]|uniref:Peptidase M15C domain-containing protein n=1 Tax=marine sediment metagenome TaxID=412755 RepID=X1HKV2_9ZZZZ